MRGIVDCFDGGLEKMFSELAPETIEHDFGGGLASIFLDDSGVKCDAFLLFVLIDVARFVFRCGGPRRVSGGLLLDFQPGVYVICE